MSGDGVVQSSRLSCTEAERQPTVCTVPFASPKGVLLSVLQGVNLKDETCQGIVRDEASSALSDSAYALAICPACRQTIPFGSKWGHHR